MLKLVQRLTGKPVLKYPFSHNASSSALVESHLERESFVATNERASLRPSVILTARIGQPSLARLGMPARKARKSQKSGWCPYSYFPLFGNDLKSFCEFHNLFLVASSMVPYWR